MLLGQTKIYDVDLSVFSVEHKIGGLDITMDKTALVDLFDRNYHLNQNLDCDFQVIFLLETASRFGQIDAEQVHHDEVLLAILHVLVRVGHMLKS